MATVASSQPALVCNTLAGGARRSKFTRGWACFRKCDTTTPITHYVCTFTYQNLLPGTVHRSTNGYLLAHDLLLLTGNSVFYPSNVLLSFSGGYKGGGKKFNSDKTKKWSLRRVQSSSLLVAGRILCASTKATRSSSSVLCSEYRTGFTPLPAGTKNRAGNPGVGAWGVRGEKHTTATYYSSIWAATDQETGTRGESHWL